MKLQVINWPVTPWGKATTMQWRYALRNAIGMCLALMIAYGLNLDEPYWAMTSAAVVGFPTPGAVISKSLGRIAGSLVGASAALMIAGHTLSDPWLFLFSMAAWLALCTWAASFFINNASYAFMLAGYTAAIIAFPLVNSVETVQLWDIAQARVCEVITGILCGGLMMMVIPNATDGRSLIVALSDIHTRLPLHAELLWHTQDIDRVRGAHQEIISRMLTINLLRIQAFWSNPHYRRHNNLLNYLLHQQLRLISVISGLRRILLNWPTPPATLSAKLDAILETLTQGEPDRYLTSKKIAALATLAPQDYRLAAFVKRLNYFCQIYLNTSRWLRLLQHPETMTIIKLPKTPPLFHYTDRAEALWNGLRTFATMTLIGAWCIACAWPAGSGAMTLGAIGCVLYSQALSPQGSLTLLGKTLLWLSLFSFLMKFGFMIQVNALWQFMLVLFPLLVTLQLLKQQQLKRAALWGQLVVFMGSFLAVTNPPVYDLSAFLNDNFAKMVGVGCAWLAFAILKPSSDNRRNQRYVRALRHSFADQLKVHPQMRESQFESLIYHYLHQLSNNRDSEIRRPFLRLGVVMLNCSHVVWALRDWQPATFSQQLIRKRCMATLHRVISDTGVKQPALHHALDTLLQMSQSLAMHPSPASQELAGLIWRLYCSLSQLTDSSIAANP